MAGLAAVTQKIRLYASVALLTLPPALVARMAVTIDDISGGRFGVNIVSGWQKAEYEQMGLWPGEAHFARRYDYSSEYVRILRELWDHGVSDFKGDYFTMQDCRLSPRPAFQVNVVAAGQSPRGMRFAAEYADYNFILGVGVNTPTAYAPVNETLLQAARVAGRDVGSYVLFMIIAGETDAAAEATWQHYKDGTDVTALAWMAAQGAADTTADESSTARRINLPEGAVNLNMGTLVGSYERIASMLDEAASIPGTKGIMLVFDDFVAGMEAFGTRIQPLMRCRAGRIVV